MAQHMLHRIDVRSGSHLQSGESMTEAMERDSFSFNPGLLQSGLQFVLRHLTCQPLENNLFARFSTKRIRLITYRQCALDIRLFRTEPDAPTSIGRLLNILPTKSKNITDTQPRKTTEQRCRLKHRHSARSLSQSFQLIERQKLPPVLDSLDSL